MSPWLAAQDNKAMAKIAEQRSNDWLGNAYTNLAAWWLPKGAIIAALFAAVPLRAATGLLPCFGWASRAF
jgi:hypothetical protein